jgi:hypothetical protein
MLASYTELLNALTAPTTKECVEEYMQHKAAPRDWKSRHFYVREGIRPVDLYCYLFGRFGPPNGVQSVVRADDSNNVFHWHYSLNAEGKRIEILAATYKIEVFYPEAFCYSNTPQTDFISAIKADFQTYKDQIKAARSRLEKWFQFVNPYKRLKSALDRMRDRATELANRLPDRPEHPKSYEELQGFIDKFRPTGEILFELFGLCLSIRMLAPVLGESFVNLLLFALARPDVRADSRVYDSIRRQHIDVRIKSLHRNCIGFHHPVNYTSEACKAFHTLMNARNDTLHGNIAPETTYHEEVYFDGTVPLFTEWRDFYTRCFAHHLRSHSIDAALSDLTVVHNFTEDVIACLESNAQLQVRGLLDTLELGFSPATQRLGVLFSDYLHDYFIDAQGTVAQEPNLT